MGELKLPGSLMEVASRGRITGDDVRDLRKEFFGDHKIEKHEVEALLALDRSAKEKCRTWQFLLTDAFTQYLIEQTPGRRDISEKEGKWFASCIAKNGVVESPELFELLVKVMETAATVPAELEKIALEQVAEAVLRNQGPVAQFSGHDQKVICKSDVDLMRRLLFSCGGDGGLAITRMEAEFLFDLNDKTVDYGNDESWSDLFVKAIGNYLLATLGDAVPHREISLASTADDPDKSVWDSLISNLRSVYRAAKPLHDEMNYELGERNKRVAEQTAMAHVVTEEEGQWVASRIGVDGTVHDNERALLDFIREEHGALPDYLEKLANAA